MKKKLKAKFLPLRHKQDNYYQLHMLRQGTKGVEEYAREFEHLMMKCDLEEEEEHTCVRFLTGLDYKVAHVVELQKYEGLDNLIQLACRMEKQQETRGRLETSRNFARNPLYVPNSVCAKQDHSRRKQGCWKPCSTCTKAKSRGLY